VVLLEDGARSLPGARRQTPSHYLHPREDRAGRDASPEAKSDAQHRLDHEMGQVMRDRLARAEGADVDDHAVVPAHRDLCTAPRRSGEAHRQCRGWPPSKDLPAFGRTETGGPAVTPPPPIPSAGRCHAQRASRQLNIPWPMVSTTGLTRERDTTLASPTQDSRSRRYADPSEPECSGSGCRPITRTAPSLVCAQCPTFRSST